MVHAQGKASAAPGPRDGATLSLRQVTFGFEPGNPLIDIPAATLSPGRVCVVLGPNAAGKSTLLRLILGELTPWRGSIELAGQPIGRLKADERAGMMSYVPQRGGTSFAFTVRQVVEMGRFALCPRPGAAGQAIAQCDLAGLEDRIYSQLSVGQQQRVLLARAMAQSAGDGRLMLLDEPGSAMDLRHVHQMMRTLRRLADDAGLAALVVLHDLNVAASYADDIWLMDAGRLVAQGPWREVMEPAVLSPVYQMELVKLPLEGQDRPVFVTRQAAGHDMMHQPG